MKSLWVVVVHPSAVARGRFATALARDGDIAVAADAANATDAIEAVRAANPDVVVLALQTPDGGSLLVIEELMATSPVPILLLSNSRAGRNSEDAVAALVAGAVDVIPEPARGDAEAEAVLRSRVRIVAGVAVIRRGRRRTAPARRQIHTLKDLVDDAVPIVAIGASTGGPAALAAVLGGLQALDAAVLVVQHLHADFVGGLVSWMDRVSSMHVEEAKEGVRLRRGVVYIAPAGRHLRIVGDDKVVLDALPETLHRPSVDVLFSSLAERAKGRTVGVLLTGMGEDGAAGLLALRRRGDTTIVQDEQSSVVFGMPRAAQRLGAAGHVLPLEEIAAAITRAL